LPSTRLFNLKSAIANDLESFGLAAHRIIGKVVIYDRKPQVAMSEDLFQSQITIQKSQMKER